ncbi:ABC transporter permease [Citromicrobium bathyomarinum]
MADLVAEMRPSNLALASVFARAEFMKLRGSLALLLCLVAPVSVIVLNLAISLDQDIRSFAQFASASAALWSFAMLPMAVTALSVLLTQMEHSRQAWDHALSHEGARPFLYTAKMGVAAVLTLAMHGVLAVAMLIGWLLLRGLPGSDAWLGEFAMSSLVLAKMAASAMLMVALQMGCAILFRSAVPPLCLGIVGTMAATGAVLSRQGIYFPWLFAINVMSTPHRAAFVIWFGLLGGLAMFAGLSAFFSLRERN